MKSLPQMGDFVFLRELLDRGNIDGEVGRAVGEGHAAGDWQPRHRAWKARWRVIGLHGLDEFFRCRVDVFGLEENFGGAAPAGDQARDLRGLFEIRDVFLDLQGQLVFVFGFFNVRAVKSLDVVGIEGGLHRLDRREEGFHFREVFGAQYARVRGGLIGVVLEDVPAAEFEVFQFGERDKFLDLRRVAVGAFAETDGTELCQRSDRMRFTFADQLHAGHEGGANGAHPGK